MGTNLQPTPATPAVDDTSRNASMPAVPDTSRPAAETVRVVPLARPEAPDPDPCQDHPAQPGRTQAQSGLESILEAARQNGPVKGQPFKRLLDVAVALSALIFLSPLLLLIALLVWAQDRGPVLFGHSRIGAHGRAFNCLKFRTMRVDAEEKLEQVLASCPRAAAEWQAQRKLKLDPRVTPLGRFLRRSSIDELPQFWNVLAGEMSLVGPRPVVMEDLELHGADVVHYLGNRPGVTGLWQISGRTDTDYGTRVALDRAYSETRSFSGDLVILLKTVPKVLFGKGAY